MSESERAMWMAVAIMTVALPVGFILGGVLHWLGN